MHCFVCVLLLCPRDISKLYHVSSGCMANIALSPRGATHPRASVQYLPYIPPSRDITITCEHAQEAMVSLYKSLIPCNFVPMA